MFASAPRQKDIDSGIFDVPTAPTSTGCDLRRVEDRFIEAWARMAGAFAMDTNMGRIHALVYVSPEALDIEAISARLGYPAELVEIHVQTLLDYNLIFRQGRGFVAEQDPWTWFARTIRARQSRELLPIRNAIESVRDAARLLAQSEGGPGAARIRAVVSRIERFTAFVGDFVKLVDAFVTLGAAPMLKFASMTSRLVPRRVA